MTGPQLPRDDLGYPVRVARPARRAVSLVPSLTKSVTVTQVNAALKAAAEGALKGLPDPRPGCLLRHRRRPGRALSIARAPWRSGDEIRVIGWYEYEWGYSTGGPA